MNNDGDDNNGTVLDDEKFINKFCSLEMMRRNEKRRRRRIQRWKWWVSYYYPPPLDALLSFVVVCQTSKHQMKTSQQRYSWYLFVVVEKKKIWNNRILNLEINHHRLLSHHQYPLPLSCIMIQLDSSSVSCSLLIISSDIPFLPS